MEKHQYKELVIPTTPQAEGSPKSISEINPIPEAADQENRKSRRKRALMSAEIKFNENFASVKCIIRNISDTGALIKVTDTNVVPNSFTLQIPMQGIEVKCQVIDQAGHQIRIKFIGEKHQLNSKKVQYIDATSTISDGASDQHPEPVGRSGNNQYRKSSSVAKSTNKLISSFRQRKIEPK
jgi:hypothetical protein